MMQPGPKRNNPAESAQRAHGVLAHAAHMVAQAMHRETELEEYQRRFARVAKGDEKRMSRVAGAFLLLVLLTSRVSASDPGTSPDDPTCPPIGRGEPPRLPRSPRCAQRRASSSAAMRYRHTDAYVELRGCYGCSRATARASSAAEETLIFLKTVRRWLSTVRTLMSSAVAMPLELFPTASRSMTWRSRGVSRAMRSASSACCAVASRACASSLRASRMRSSSAFGGTGFRRKSIAPPLNARTEVGTSP